MEDSLGPASDGVANQRRLRGQEIVDACTVAGHAGVGRLAVNADGHRCDMGRPAVLLDDGKVAAQARPAGEAVLAGEHQLSVDQAELAWLVRQLGAGMEGPSGDQGGRFLGSPPSRPIRPGPRTFRVQLPL